MEEKQLERYLASVGITGPLADRVKSIYSFYVEMLHIKVADIVVSEYVKEDSSREYESLWFFSDQFVMEAKRFVKDDDFDLAPSRSRVIYWAIEKQDYDFKKATEKSRLNVQFTLDSGISGHLKASKENCDHVRDVFSKFIVTNIQTKTALS